MRTSILTAGQKKLLAFAGGALILIVLVAWILNYGFLRLTVPMPREGSLKIELINEIGAIEKTVENFDGSKKLLLSKGEYEVRVTGAEYSLLKTVESKGLLRTTTLSSSVKKEHQRSFVGYNPSPCMSYLNQTLFSYECRDRVNGVSVHVPATDTTPTFTVPAGQPEESIIQDVAQTKLGTVLLSGALFEDERESIESYPSISLVDNKLEIKNPRPLLQIDPTGNYKLAAYKDGFVVYKDDLSQVLYFANLNAEPKEISIPAGDSESRAFLRSSEDSLLAFYGREASGFDADAVESIDLKTPLYVVENGMQKTYTLPEPVLDAAPCEGYICVVDIFKTLTVYKPSQDGLNKITSFQNVNELISKYGNVYGVTDTGILEINPNNASAFYSYTFGKYIYCGWQNTSEGYILCLIDEKSNKLALLVNVNEQVIFPIDKRLTALQANSGIATVSAYKNRVFISPVFRISPKGEIDEDDKQKGEQLLQRLLPELGLISENGIFVINTISVQ